VGASDVAHQRQYVWASISMAQERQRTVPHSWQRAMRVAGRSIVIPHSQFVCMTRPSCRRLSPPGRVKAM
jgi:hypothetical protein